MAKYIELYGNKPFSIYMNDLNVYDINKYLKKYGNFAGLNLMRNYANISLRQE